MSNCREGQGENRQSKESLSLFLDILDEKSRKIFWYFRWNGHARLAELTNLIGASSDMEVLYRIKEVINPAAVRIFGRPLLEFSESRIDRITGKKVLFHWWLLAFTEDIHPLKGKEGKSLVDIFDEDDHIVIISEISPIVTVKDTAKVEQRHGILSIRLNKNQ